MRTAAIATVDLDSIACKGGQATVASNMVGIARIGRGFGRIERRSCMQTIGFDQSFIRFRIDRLVQPAITVTHMMPTTVNNVRINVESRCEIVDLQTERSHVYLLGASCKTERVGAAENCWLEPNADFCLIASDEEFLTIKSWARNDLTVAKHPEAPAVPRERQSGRIRDAWPEFRMQVRAAQGRRLSSFEAIIDSIRGDRPIVAHTEYTDGDYRVLLDHPVKTINYSERENVYQTDTGPIILPDLSPDRLKRCEWLVECFDLAYSTFNSESWAEFIVKTRTPVGGDITVDHYAQPRRIEPVTNVLIEVLDVSDEQRPKLHRLSDDRLIRSDGASSLVR